MIVMMLQQPPAGTTDTLKTGSKVVPSPAPTARMKTSTAGVSGGAHLHYSHRPPLRHCQVQQAAVPDRHEFGPLRVPLQANPTAQ